MNITTAQKNKIVKLLKSEGVVFAYLFGSMARGRHNSLSDVDIAIMVKQKSKISTDNKAIFALEQKLSVILKRRTDLIVLNTTRSALLKEQVVFGGRLFFCSDDNLRKQYEASVMREYEDMRHIYNVQFRLLGERLKINTFGTQKVRSRYLSKYVAAQ